MHLGLISEAETVPALVSIQQRQDRGFPTPEPGLQGLPVRLGVKNPPANAGGVKDSDSTPGSGRSPGGGNGNPLHYSQNPMDRGT